MNGPEPESGALTFEEVEEYGTPLMRLKDGDWFATVSAADPYGLKLGVFTGKLIYNGVGSSLVQLDREFDSRIRWAPETKVIPLAKPKKEQMNGFVSTTHFTEEE